MKNLLWLLLLPFLFSCKDPVPVYFPGIPGTQIDSFPRKICGSYIGLEDIKKEIKTMQETFPANTGDSDFIEFDTTATGMDTATSKVLRLNRLACSDLLAPIDSVEKTAKRKIMYGVLRIVPSGLNFDFMDSLGVRSEVALIRKGPNVKFSSWKEDYFIAQKTAWGWEMIVLDFQHKDLFSIRLGWFDRYNGGAKSEKEFLASLAYLGTKFKAAKDKEGKIVGVTAALKPDEIIELYKKADMTPLDFCRY